MIRGKGTLIPFPIFSLGGAAAELSIGGDINVRFNEKEKILRT